MFSTAAIKHAIPVIFAGIIFCFLFSLNADNKQLRIQNDTLRDEVKQISSKNDGLASALRNLIQQTEQANQLAANELRRQQRAETSNVQLQKTINAALGKTACADTAVPAAVAERLRAEADRIRRYSGTTGTHPGRSAP